MADWFNAHGLTIKQLGSMMLLVGPADSAVPFFDTTARHAEAAVDLAVADA